ncbi:MAG: substrate-binding domain-containing protein [Kiritimatiellia bacterium]|jgi:LacI family transcriptional regulator
MAKLKKVALLLPRYPHLDRLENIIDLIEKQGGWQLYLHSESNREPALPQLVEWGCSGIILYPENPTVVAAARRAQVPTVVLEPPPEMRRGLLQKLPWDYGFADNASIADAAADYFLDRQYRSFAFVDEVDRCYWSEERWVRFSRRIGDAGFPCERYPAVPKRMQGDWPSEEIRMIGWLQRLPKPVAVFASWDKRARQVLEACLTADIAVPQSVAVLGVDNDPTVCKTTMPALSSIPFESNFEVVIKILNARMSGKKFDRVVWKTQAAPVATRLSTDFVAAEDPVVARALRYIRYATATSAISVGDVVAHVKCSRRLLEKRLRAATGRTPLEEIHRSRLERVCGLLATSKMRIGEIAAACGFENRAGLDVLFRRTFGTTMRDWRAQNRKDIAPGR